MPKVRYFPEIAFTGGGRRNYRYYYYRLLEMPLWKFFSAVVAVFIGLNLIYALIYFLLKTVLSTPGMTFLDCLYFSMVTFSTVGYGDIHPLGIGRIIAVVEIFNGILFIGTLTGLLFARFSQAPSPFVWSSPVVIRKSGGKTFFQVRAANVVGTDVVNVRPQLFLQRLVRGKSGSLERDLIPMELDREQIPVFAFSWIFSHEVSGNSPAKNWLDKQFGEQERLIGFIHGFDSKLGRDVYGYARWQPSDLAEGEFEEVIENYTEDKNLRVSVKIDLDKLDRVRRL